MNKTILRSILLGVIFVILIEVVIELIGVNILLRSSIVRWIIFLLPCLGGFFTAYYAPELKLILGTLICVVIGSCRFIKQVLFPFLDIPSDSIGMTGYVLVSLQNILLYIIPCFIAALLGMFFSKSSIIKNIKKNDDIAR